MQRSILNVFRLNCFHFRLLSLAVCSLFFSTSSLATSRIADAEKSNVTQQPPAVGVNVSHSLLNPTQDVLQLGYDNPVRVAQILSDTLTNISLSPKVPNANIQAEAIYWAGSALYTQSSDPEIELLKRTVLNQLSLVSAELRGEDKASVSNLATWVETLPTQRVLLRSLDYDLVRININANPLISDNVTIVVPYRPQTVTVMGAVTFTKAANTTESDDSKPYKAQWQEGFSARDYLKQFTVTDSAENSVATVIQPDGVIEKHPIAYWNYTHKNIAPGAIVYLPFTSLPKGAAALNKDMVQLLRNSAL